MYPMIVALEIGRYIHSCFVVIIGNVTRNPAIIAFSRDFMVDKNKET